MSQNSSTRKLISVSELFSDGFGYFAKHWQMLMKAFLYGMAMYLGASLLMGIVVGIAVGVGAAAKLGINLLTGTIIVVGSIGLFGFLLAIAGKMMLLQLQAVKSPIEKVRDAWRAISWKNGLSIYGTLILYMFAVYTGIIALVIPGIVIGNWLVFTFFAWESGKGGVQALVKSRDYVRGYWWAVFGRMLLIGLAMILAFGVVVFAYMKMVEAGTLFAIIGYILYILSLGMIGAIASRMMYRLYSDLVEIKGEIKTELSGWRKFRWNLLAFGPLVLGLIATLIIMGLNPGAQIKKAQEQTESIQKANDLVRQQDQLKSQIESQLESKK